MLKILLLLFINKEEQNLKYIKKINSLGITIPPRTVKDISIKIKGIDVEVRIYSLPNGNFDLNSAWEKI